MNAYFARVLFTHIPIYIYNTFFLIFIVNRHVMRVIKCSFDYFNWDDYTRGRLKKPEVHERAHNVRV